MRLPLPEVKEWIHAENARWRVIFALRKMGKVVGDVDIEDAEDGYHLLIGEELTAEEEAAAREAVAQEAGARK